ncbi:MAG: glycosyltransferase family 2 protein [Clostridia bacterium]|nr:glycosyltransferase family 2 protein [Clostridia bacterium]
MSNEITTAPFLSVLMRTQGKRSEALKEALLSLEAQSDDDFEILLILHRPTEADQAKTLKLLEALSPSLKDRLTWRVLEHGTRSAPLNLALSLARGEYLAMLDDDDVIFEDWVENFHRGAQKHPGAMIRSYGMTQYWNANPVGDALWLQAAEAPEPTYCAPFDLQKQLTDNYTPISCMAVPRACYSEQGIAFDETLTTAEDWDFMMRCALLCGLYDSGRITFLYRLWKNAETSHTVHQNDEWLKNRETILQKIEASHRQAVEKGTWHYYGEDATATAIPKRSFGKRLRNAIRTHGLLGFPVVVVRKIWYRLFG